MKNYLIENLTIPTLRPLDVWLLYLLLNKVEVNDCNPSTTSIRKSIRTSKALAHLNDYVCYTASYWCNLVSYDSFAQEQDCSPSCWNKPKNYKDASKDPKWIVGHAQRIDYP